MITPSKIDRAALVIQACIADPLKRPKSEPEELLAFQLKAIKAPLFERQFRIHPKRKFLADFYFPVSRLVVEVDGGVFTHGRHSRGAGITRDCEKTAYIAAMPARLLRVTPAHVKNGQAIDWILQAL